MPQKTKREKCKLVADLLNGAFLKWQMQLGAPVSQNQWAKRIGVPNTSYSHWVNEITNRRQHTQTGGRTIDRL